MRKDQIFVLLLVIFLPLTGCFGGSGIGDVEGEETTDGTSDNELFTTFVTIEPNDWECGKYSSCFWEPIFSIHSDSGSGIQVVSFSSSVEGNYSIYEDNYNSISSSGFAPKVVSTCESGQTWNTTISGINEYILNSILPTVGDECQHEFFASGQLSDPGQRDSATVDVTSIQFSITWKVHDITVV